MANKYSGWSSYLEYKDNKVRARVEYNVTESSINWHIEFDFAKSGDAQYLWWRWSKSDGGWSDWKKSNGKHSKNTNTQSYSVARPTLKVQFGIGESRNKTTSIPEIENKVKAYKPETITANKINDARFEITITGKGAVTVPTKTLVVEKAVDTQTSWSEFKTITVNSTGSYTKTVTDDTTEAGHKYWWRVKATGDYGESGYITCSAEYTSPETSADVDVEEGSGFNTIVWSVDSVSDIDRGIIEGWYVRRSENGGAYQTIATVQASASQYNYSYVDYDISSGSTYKYDIQSFGSGGTSHESQEGGSEITTAPSKPISVRAYKNENDYVVINISDSSSNTADKVLIERSIDGGSYSQIAEVDFPCDTYTDETAVGSDTIKYRVRNHNSKGYSAYTESNSVLLKSKPNPPTLMQPYNDTIQDVSSQPIRLVWMHNATDGSPQREAEIKVTIDGVAQTYTATTQSFVEIAGFDINDSVEWTVRTKGSHADFSDWSAPYTFRVLKKPELTILSPLNSEVITTLPITLEWLYNDLSGELKELSITLIKDNKEVAKYIADPSTSEYSFAGFLFENHSVYGIRVDALSTTGLKASQLISVVIEYEAVSLEGGLLPTIVTDDTGYAYITIGRDITGKRDIDGCNFVFNEKINPTDMPFTRKETYSPVAGVEIEINVLDVNFEYSGIYEDVVIDKIGSALGTEGDMVAKMFLYHDTRYSAEWTQWVTQMIAPEEQPPIWHALDPSMQEYYEQHIGAGDYTQNDEFIDWLIANSNIGEVPEIPPEPIEIAEAYLYRVHDKQRELLGAVNEGTQIIDKYAPFNVDFEYELLQLTEDGRISLVSVTVNLPSSESFIYFGNGEMFKGKWNPESSKSMKRPERVFKRYSGREHPIVYDSKAKDENDRFSCVLVDRNEYVQLCDLMRAGHGVGIWKSVNGDSYDAAFEIDFDWNNYYKTRTWKVSLDITRIEKDGK